MKIWQHMVSVFSHIFLHCNKTIKFVNFIGSNIITLALNSTNFMSRIYSIGQNLYSNFSSLLRKFLLIIVAYLHS